MISHTSKFIPRKHFIRALQHGNIISSVEPYKRSYLIHYNVTPDLVPYLTLYNIPYVASLLKFNLVTSDLYYELLESNPEYFI